ncbi:hypothetical protein [Simplicispira metamorpha]|uniref:RloB-like protein n=1 Tax=Simplicispira metamorpha TaxID=80881 RepID=A0A4V2SJI1_9BURK|nr:hypothetical protein [Simplicispira metamorpha]MBP8141684.1 hypothetical protein [Acidovorax sp.]MBP8204641.1 hypothetical protein [Giesbergeria sp.]TCP15414.1 RloB-like protein [Simplicispira metamorpha]
MAKRPLRKTNRTVLVVVEGETEEAFVGHLKSLYYRRGMQLSVSIRNAHGHGPQGVIDKLKSVAQTADFDHRIAVLDADIPLTAAEQQWLQSAQVETIVSVPAIEATLLAILGKRAPTATNLCKNALQKQAPGDTTEARYYEKHFQLSSLEKARSKVQVLDALIVAVSTE